MSPGFATAIGCHAIAKWYFEGDCALSKPRPPAYQVSEEVFWSASGTSETSCWSLRQSGASNGGTSGWMSKEFREEIVRSRWEAGENGKLHWHGVVDVYMFMNISYVYFLCIFFAGTMQLMGFWTSSSLKLASLQRKRNVILLPRSWMHREGQQGHLRHWISGGTRSTGAGFCYSPPVLTVAWFPKKAGVFSQCVCFQVSSADHGQTSGAVCQGSSWWEHWDCTTSSFSFTSCTAGWSLQWCSRYRAEAGHFGALGQKSKSVGGIDGTKRSNSEKKIELE